MLRTTRRAFSLILALAMQPLVMMAGSARATDTVQADHLTAAIEERRAFASERIQMMYDR